MPRAKKKSKKKTLSRKKKARVTAVKKTEENRASTTHKTLVLLDETIDYHPVIVKALRAIPDDLSGKIRRSRQMIGTPKANTSVAHNIAVLDLTVRLLKCRTLKQQVELLADVIKGIESNILLPEQKERDTLTDL